MTQMKSQKAWSLNSISRLVSMVQQKRVHFLMVSVALSHLTACNAAGGKEQDAKVEPTSLQITSTDRTVKSVASLSPTENGGVFFVKWHDQETLTAVGSAYDVNVYLSNDQTADGQDTSLYSTYNLGLGTLYAMDTPGGTGPDHSIACTYGSDNSIDCIGRSDGSSKIDIQAFLNALPKSAYIVVQACTKNGGPCSQTSTPVTLE